MNVLTLLKSVFSLDALVYLAIALVFLGSLARCVLPVSRAGARLRRAARTIIAENKQNKERKSWNDLRFLGDRMQGAWADFLQNAELRDAHGESCDVSQYVNEETVIASLGGTRLAELTPGFLTSLGILGTFLGLVMGLSGLTLSAADTTQLLGAMDQLIGGMSTAFLTSIAGVVASLAFNILNNHALTKCQRSIDRFCEVFGLYAMPKPVSEETAMLALQQEQTAYIRQAAEDISQKLAVQMEQSILRAMLPVQRSMDNFILAATQAQVEGVDRIAHVFVQRMNVALGQEFDHLRQVLAETGLQQQQAQREMRAAAEAVSQMTQDVVNMHQLSQGVIEHFQAYVADMEASRARADEANRQALDLIASMDRTLDRQAQYLNGIDHLNQTLVANQQQYTAWTDKFLQSAQEQTRITGREMDRVVERMHEGAEALAGAHGTFTRGMEENVARTTALLDESITSAIRQMNVTLEAMNEQTRVVPQLLSQSRERYAEQVDQFVTALVRLQKAMDRLSDAQGAPGKGKE